MQLLPLAPVLQGINMKFSTIIGCFISLLVCVSSYAQSSFGFAYSGRGTSVAVGSSNGYGGTYAGAYAGSYGGYYPVTFTGYCAPTTWPYAAQVPVAATLQQRSVGAPAYFVYPQPIVPYYPVWGGGYVTGTILPNCR